MHRGVGIVVKMDMMVSFVNEKDVINMKSKRTG